MSADQNAAHYIWYERFAANVQSSLGDKVKLGYFPDSQLGKEADIVLSDSELQAEKIIAARRT